MRFSKDVARKRTTQLTSRSDVNSNASRSVHGEAIDRRLDESENCKAKRNPASVDDKRDRTLSRMKNA